MNLGIFLSIGDSLEDMKKSGQDERFINLYLNRYLKAFNKIYLFSYDELNFELPKNVVLVNKKNKMHRYLYALLLPLLYKNTIERCDVIRGFGLSSSVSSFLISRPIFKKKISFVFNWPYDYWQFLALEKKYAIAIVFKILEFTAFFRADTVLVATRDKLKKVKGKKYVYLPNGVDTSLFKPIARKKSGIIFVGRLEKQKNLIFLLDAVSNLVKKERVITFVGKGSQEKKLKEYAIKKNVELTVFNPVPNSQLPKLLSKFSIFTLTSFAEGSPKVLLEAMAMGLVPTVTSFSTSKDIIKNGQNGFVTDFDVLKYSRRLENLLNNNALLKKISKNTRESVEKDFNLEKLIASEIKILKNASK